MKVLVIIAISFVCVIVGTEGASKSLLQRLFQKRAPEKREHNVPSNLNIDSCAGVHCPPATCVDLEYLPGKCCPICPTGSNCWNMNKIIPAHQNVIVRNEEFCSTYCRCPNPSTYATEKENTQATCHATCFNDFFYY